MVELVLAVCIPCLVGLECGFPASHEVGGL